MSQVRYVGYQDYLHHHQLTLEDLQRLITHELGDLRGGSICATGSLFAGHGTLASDIDVYLIVSDAEFSRLRHTPRFRCGGARVRAQRTFRGAAVDIEVVLGRALERALSRICVVTAAASEESLTNIDPLYTDDDLGEIFTRILTAMPLAEAEILRRLQVRCHAAGYYRWRSRVLVAQAKAHGDDVGALQQAGDVEAAWIESRFAAELGALALVSSHRIPVDRTKWIPWAIRQLEASQPVARQYWEFWRPGGRYSIMSSTSTAAALDFIAAVEAVVYDGGETDAAT